MLAHGKTAAQIMHQISQPPLEHVEARFVIDANRNPPVPPSGPIKPPNRALPQKMPRRGLRMTADRLTAEEAYRQRFSSVLSSIPERLAACNLAPVASRLH